jgi:hypothetical protein
VFQLSENCFFTSIIFSSYNFPSKCPNTLSALDIHVMMSYQCFQALCAVNLVRGHCMLILSMMLEEEDDYLLLLPYHHHHSILHNNHFFFLLDSMFMNNESEQVIPHLLPASLNHTYDLLDKGWCYHHTCFNVCQL